MIDYVAEGGEAPIMVKPAFLVRPKAGEGSGSIFVGGRPIGLKRIHTDFLWRMQIISRLGEQWRHVATGALSFVAKNLFALHGRFFIETTFRRLRGRNGAVIKIQSGQIC